ncbi:hypothetical protein ABZS88_11320 [Streptomyces sp. NPDC005480]|uniref:hypothetical protein n=1 Tax=Streptomyces sp. NPDC005480 TaxID=3154880 RepID=UPI0033A0929E
MTPHEIQILAVGIALGAHCMNATHMILAYRDDRRRDAAARRQARLLAADRYHHSLRLYQLQQSVPA